MLEINNAKINKEMEELLNSFEFIDKPNFKNYDSCDIEDDYITLYREDEYERDEYDNYVISKEGITRRFKRNNMTGVFVEY